MGNRAKAVMFGVLMPVIILMSGCAVSHEAEEAMQTQLQVETLKDEMLKADNNIELKEEVKEELTAQLLTDNKLDTSILKSSRKTKCTFDLPAGFEESEDMPGMYLNEHYPVDVSTIYYAELDKNTALQLMSEETFKENMESELNQTYDSEIKLKIESFEKIKIDGFASFRILYSYTNNNIKIKQLQYIINADKTYIITYSQTDEYDRMVEFETSAETIQVTS